MGQHFSSTDLMAICPHCQTRTDDALTLCPTGDGYYTIEEDEYQSHSEEGLLGQAVGGRFVVTGMLGQGSMARVFRAHQINVERDVALKVFEAKRFADQVSSTNSEEALEHARERFSQEAKVLAKVSHPNCVTLYDYGVDDSGGYIYIAMEYVSGMSLRKAITRGLKADAIVEISQQILLALREAHALGIVHRDLKPENIILTLRFATEEQLVKVVDFGIAKMLGPQDYSRTKVGTLFGTPAYMSPEQCRGETSTVGPHSDIYSLGCILYEMISGHLPFEERSPQAMVAAHTTKPVPPLAPRPGLQLPAGFVDFVMKCVRKEPEQRWENGQAALVALNEMLTPNNPVSTAEFMRIRASASNIAPSSKVVVPQNQIRGEELNPPTQDMPAPQLPQSRVTQRSADLSGENIFETHSGKNAKKQKSAAAATDSTSRGMTAMALFGLILAIAFVAILFFYIYKTIMGT